MIRLLSAALLVAGLGACDLLVVDPDRPSAPPVAEGVAALETVEVLRGVPGAEAARPLPTVVALHGLGDTPEAFVHVFDGHPGPLRVVAVRAPEPHGEGHRWVDPSVAWSTPAFAEAMAERSDAVAATIRALRADGKIQGRPVVTGFSQGGMVSFAVAGRHPDALAGAVPVGGLMPPGIAPARSRGTTTVVALHGADDERVPLAGARAATTLLREAGHDTTLQPFEGVGHSIPQPVREALYEAVDRMLAAEE